MILPGALAALVYLAIVVVLGVCMAMYCSVFGITIDVIPRDSTRTSQYYEKTDDAEKTKPSALNADLPVLTMNYEIVAHMPPSVVSLLVCLALIWGAIVACYIADLCWAVFYASAAIKSIRESQQRRQALLRRPVFVVGRENEQQEAYRGLIRNV